MRFGLVSTLTQSASEGTGSKQMTQIIRRRLGLGAVLVFAMVPAVFSAGGQQPESFKGKVVPLASLLEKQGAKLDADAADHWLALLMDDGKVLTIIKDDGSRMFFKDKSLLDRPMRLTGRLIPKSQMLQVVNVHSIVKGQLHEVYYWCDICTIRMPEPGDCACCGAKLMFREVPLP